jgi:hypothetical protein
MGNSKEKEAPISYFLFPMPYLCLNSEKILRLVIGL